MPYHCSLLQYIVPLVYRNIVVCFVLEFLVSVGKVFQTRNIHFKYLIFLILIYRPSLGMVGIHKKCRFGVYPGSVINRFQVPDDKVNWATEYKTYKPLYYTAPVVFGKFWADLEIGDPTFKPKWNNLDGNISRKSHIGTYQVRNGYPRNPIGRTGIWGRGLLGRWGPNHAADPIVTRWKKLANGEVEHDKDNKPILQFVAIKRGDTGEWALPGGMVNPGEKINMTAIREFHEEAMNSLVVSEDKKQQWKVLFEDFFSKGSEIYKGYVDDHRNTDNSWMETVAYNFHDEDGSVVGGLHLEAGDDAVGVRWVDITPDLKLYASHEDIIKTALRKHVPNN